MHKFLNNCVSGKTIEDVRKQRIFKLADTEAAIKKFVDLSTFFGANILNEKNVTLIELKKKRALFNKPLQVGCAILDLAKCRIVDFHYRINL